MTTRGQATRLLQEQHTEVASLLARLDDDAFSLRGTIGGGEWSAKDLALHLGSWEEIALETLGELGRGERPSIEDAFAVEGATDRLNEEQVNLQLDVAPQGARARFEERHRRIVGAIAAMDDEAWIAPYAFDPDDATVGGRIGSLLGSDAGGFTHAAAHMEELRAYVASTDR